MFRFSIRDLLWLTVVASLAVGWGLDRWSRSFPIGQLTGRVTLDGQPLDGGWVSFHGVGSGSAAAKTDAAGVFRVNLIEPGKCRVVIDHGQIRLPSRYSSAQQSVLVCEVREGANTLDFDLRSQ